MTERRAHGHSKSGRAISDQDVKKLSAEAEPGFDVETLTSRRNERGRTALGRAPARVESVRLDPELGRRLIERARSEGTTPSKLIRETLRRYFQAASLCIPSVRGSAATP
jgi:uncharacterized protein (DUF4415 family)